MSLVFLIAEQGPPYPTPWWVWIIIGLVFVFFCLPPLVLTVGVFFQFFTNPEKFRKGNFDGPDGRPPEDWGGGGY